MSFNAATDRRLNFPSTINGQSRSAMVFEAVVDMRAKPESAIGIDTQLLLGAPIDVFATENGWSFIRAQKDGYVGFVRADKITFDRPALTHCVIVPRTVIYDGPDMKTVSLGMISMGSQVTVKALSETRGTLYAELHDGTAIFAKHLAPIGDYAENPVAVAETLIHTPYLWGGASAFGIDCSGLVQLCFAMCGISVLRDTDMQAATIGKTILQAELTRGDLIFWKGHVALYRGDGTIIHANGHTMSVAIEGLEAAIDRIGYLYGQPTAFMRPLGNSQ